MRLPRAAALLAAAAITVSGCTNSADKPRQPAAGQSPATTAPTTPTPTPTPDPTTSPTATSAAGLTDRLLRDINKAGTAADMRWEIGTTGPASAAPFGTCARAPLADIGATAVLERTFFPPDDGEAEAAQQVSEFADAKSSAQAWAVLGSWRDHCAAKKVDGLTPKAFPMNPLAVTGNAQARWYRVDWGTSADGEPHSYEYLGMSRSGTRISVITLGGVTRAMDFMPGPDGTYPIEDPLARAAARLG